MKGAVLHKQQSCQERKLSGFFLIDGMFPGRFSVFVTGAVKYTKKQDVAVSIYI
jgi:hypothetical protein